MHERWRKDRAGGMAHYVLTHGVFGWGLMMLILMHFALQDHSPWLSQAALWLGAGLFYGLVNWFFKEKIFLKLESDEKFKDSV